MTGPGRSETVTGDGCAVIARRRMSAHIRPTADPRDRPLPGITVRAQSAQHESNTFESASCSTTRLGDFADMRWRGRRGQVPAASLEDIPIGDVVKNAQEYEKRGVGHSVERQER